MEIEKNRILITGGTGFLGGNLIRFLIHERNVTPDKIRVFYLENTSTLALKGMSDLDMVPGNILDKNSVKDACKDIDLVFHLIGNTSFEPRAKKIQWLVNVEGTRNILDEVRVSNTIKRVCYTSTVNTLGCPNPPGSLGTIETSNPYKNKPKLHSFNSPEDVLSFADSINDGTAQGKWWKRIDIGYFDSKLAAQELINRSVREDDLDLVSVLPGTFFGPHDVFIGTSLYIIRIYNNAMPGVLNGGFPCLHVDDVARGHVLAMERGKKGERYIITGKEINNLYQKDMMKLIADTIQEEEPDRQIKAKFKVFSKRMAMIGATFSELYSKIFKKPCLLSKAMVKAGNIPSFYSFERAHKDLDYVPEKSFKEGIEDAYDYLKENGFLSKIRRETL